MSQPVNCLAPCSVEAFLDRRIAPLSSPFLHVTQAPNQHRRSRSSPGYFVGKSKEVEASVLKLELISKPVQVQCEDYDAEDVLGGVQFTALPWPDTDEDNCGVYEEEVTIAQLPVVLWPDTDDENHGACFEEEEDTDLAEPLTLWPDTDSEGSEFDAPSTKVQWVNKGMQVWSGQHVASAPATQEPTTAGPPTMPAPQEPTTAGPPTMPCSQRLSLPSLLTSRATGTAKKSMSPALPVGAQPMSFSQKVAESPKTSLTAGAQPVSFGQKVSESPKTTLNIAELLDTRHTSPSKTVQVTPSNASFSPPAAAAPSIAPHLQASQLGSFNSFLTSNLAPLQQPPPPPPQHASMAMQPLISVPPPPSHDALCPGGLGTVSPANLNADILAEPASLTETRAAQDIANNVEQDDEEFMASLDDALPPSITTLMVRNIPLRIMQKTFMQELNKSGFRGQYDFCYLPTCFAKVEGKGFAFINFITPAAAGKFVGMWHRTRRFGQHEAALNISPATIQGLEANKTNWAGPRIQRIRNPNLRPWILDQAQSGDNTRALCDSVSTFQ